MKLLTKEELEVLANAPKGATHLVEYKLDKSTEYAVEQSPLLLVVGGGLSWFNMSCWQVKCSLEDLRTRKEQEDKLMKIVELANGGFLNQSFKGAHKQVAVNIMNYVSEYKSEWSGKGLPPVGCECIVNHTNESMRGVITYIGEGVGCFKYSKNNKEYSFSMVSVKFKPVETEAQKKERELNSKISEIMKSWGHEECECTTGKATSITYAVVEQMLNAGYKLPTESK